MSLRRHAGAEIVHAEERRQRLVDVGRDFLLNILRQCQRAVHGGVGDVVAGGQKLAGRIEESHIIDLEAGNGRGDEVTDGSRCLAPCGGAGADHDRCGGLLFATAEIADVRHDDMDACSGNAVNLLDGAADFALKGANARHFLHEGGQAERTDIVEKLITGIGAVRQAALGQKQPCLAGEPNGNLKAGTIGPYLKVQTRFGERNADLVEVAFSSPT